MHYLDTSALVKLVVREAESDALVSWLQSHPAVATSDLTRTELMRAVRRGAPDLVERVRDLLSRMTLITAAPRVFDDAGRLDPIEVRTLDAIHIASALQLGDDLESVVTYDTRMADVVRRLGLPVTAPA